MDGLLLLLRIEKYRDLMEKNVGRLNLANLKKTIYYLQRNGLKNTWYAAKERMEERKQPTYFFVPISSKEAQMQREKASLYKVTFSIVVPTYHTKEEHLREMIESVQNQTYPEWELVLADASKDAGVERIVKQYNDRRICYVRLEENAGISENTNQALKHVTKDYVGLLDHDDVLTRDALYEMAKAIEEGKKVGRECKLLYSDEDKCNGDRSMYFEPHNKEDFNLDLLLSNNYFCHFMVLESHLIKELGFRKEYDGAQDYDLALRAVEKLLDNPFQIVHIPKVLYHWRCHEDSTAQNPKSKQYAYEAGRRAVQSFVKTRKIPAKAIHLKHLGFYGLIYDRPILQVRDDLGAVGGKLIKKGKIVGGRISKEGKIYYENLPVSYSGPFHRAVLMQNAQAVDIRCITVREECYAVFEQVVGVPYETIPGEDIFDVSVLSEDTDYPAISLALGNAIRAAGYNILWNPAICKHLDGKKK